MRLGGPARYLVEVTTKDEVKQALDWAAQAEGLPIIMIGDGSNIVWRDEGYPGLVIVNKITGIEQNDFDENTAYFKLAAGENWDNAIAHITSKGFGGIGLLSLIPGTCGAAPVQNIGAYGAQLSDFLVTIEAFDTQEKRLTILQASDCNFGYRTSKFKTTDKNRYFITEVTVMVSKDSAANTTYHSLEGYLQAQNIHERSPAIIRDAVIAVRSSKLPDPANVANCGSFFQNPIITPTHLQDIKSNNPKLANWPSIYTWELPDGNIKIAAGAILEHEGFKGYHDQETGMATWDTQALVLVNESANSTAQLLAFKQKIVDHIKNRFNITLEQEPELLP